MCFNLETFSVDAENFDSMLIEPVVKRIASRYGSNTGKLKDAFSRCFNWIFARLPKKSFLRMLNKIGSLTEIDNGQGDIRSSNKENEYLYSIDLKAKTRDIPINYMSLKNLKNPEDMHDYVVKDIDYKSVKTVHNDAAQSVCANLFNIYNDTVMTKINGVIEEYGVMALSAGIIRGDSSTLDKVKISNRGSIVEELIDLVVNKYKLFDDDKVAIFFNEIMNRQNAESSNYFWKGAFKEYMLQYEGFDMSINSIMIHTLDFVKLALDAFADFFEKARAFIDEMKISASYREKYSLAEATLAKFESLFESKFMKIRQEYDKSIAILDSMTDDDVKTDIYKRKHHH